MKLIFQLFFLISLNTGFSQKAFLKENLDILINKIVYEKKQPQDKTLAIYTWICANIKYDDSRIGLKEFISTEDNTFDTLALIQKIISERKGVCFDYAILIKYMLNKVNIKAEIIDGYSKNEDNDFINFDTTNKLHAWNKVYLNSKWFLIDCTWGAVYYQNGNKDRYLDYFLQAPYIFITEHYPKNQLNTLLGKTISFEEFLKIPIIYSNDLVEENSMNFYRDISYIKDTLNINNIELKTENIAIKQKLIGDSLANDLDFRYIKELKKLVIYTNTKKRKFVYLYKTDSTKKRWIERILDCIIYIPEK